MEKVFSGIHNTEGGKEKNAVSTISPTATYRLSRSLTRLPHWVSIRFTLGFPGGAGGQEPACQCRRLKRWGFDPWVGNILLEEGMAPHSSNLAWRSPWTEEPGGLQSMGLQRVGHDWVTNTHTNPAMSFGSRSLKRWWDFSFYVHEENGTFHTWEVGGRNLEKETEKKLTHMTLEVVFGHMTYS